MIALKTTKQIDMIAQSSRILAEVLLLVMNRVKVGVVMRELDDFAEKMIRERGAMPSFLGYRPSFHDEPFPSSLCVSVNDEIVHGIGNRDLVLHDGDLVKLDLGVNYQGFFSDMAVTVALGDVAPIDRQLMEVTRQSLFLGIEQCQVGKTIADISRAIQQHVESHHFSVVRQLVGHGVGLAIHEEPSVPNFVMKGHNPVLKEGMVIAIEPMVNRGGYALRTKEDGWTAVTVDGSRSAHFEHTVAITKEGGRILTLMEGEMTL